MAAQTLPQAAASTAVRAGLTRLLRLVGGVPPGGSDLSAPRSGPPPSLPSPQASVTSAALKGKGGIIPLCSDLNDFDNLPASLRLLLTNRVSVRADRLIQDLPWNLLVGAKTSLTPDHRSEAEAELLKLQKFKERGIVLDATTAVAVVRKFSLWLSQHDLCDTLLRTAPPALGAVSPSYAEHVDTFRSDLTALNKMKNAVEKLIERGDFDRAESLAERASDKSRRLCQLLEHLREQLVTAESESIARLRRLGSAAGGFVVLAATLGYAETALEAFPASLVQAATDAATLAGAVCIASTTAAWLLSDDFSAELRRVQELQTQRVVVRNAIANAVDELWMTRISEHE